MLKTLAKLFAATPAPVRTNRASLRVEALEPRSVPAVLVQLIGDTLKITGDDTPDVVTVWDDGTNVSVLTAAGSSSHVSAAKVEVNLYGGDDTLRYERFANLNSAKALTIDLGAGDDTAVIDFSTPDVKVTAPLSVALAGGTGDDDVTAMFPRVRYGTLDFTANLGDDNDTAKVYLQGDVTNQAAVAVNLYGQGGADNLFLGTTDEMSAANGGNGVFDQGTACPIDLRLWGGDGNDTVRSNLDGSFNDVVNLILCGDGGRYDAGSDRVQALITLRSGSYGQVTASVYGGAGNDFLQLDYSGAGISQAEKHFVIDGGLGTMDRVVPSVYANFITQGNCEGTCPSIWYIPGLVPA